MRSKSEKFLNNNSSGNSELTPEKHKQGGNSPLSDSGNEAQEKRERDFNAKGTKLHGFKDGDELQQISQMEDKGSSQ